MSGNPISPSVLARITQAARYVVSGNAPAVWFGAGEPMKPQAPAETEGRRFDYPVGINIGTGIRTQEPVTFDDLRALADNCDILRSVIETRKDQMEALDWTVRTRDAHASPEMHKQAAQVQDFLQYPDGEHSFSQWMRQVLEDMFVIDAVAIYKRRNRSGGIYALEIVDGGSIRLLLDDSGRTPQTPDPAYQQILKGIPAVDYTRDELIYIQHNPRSYKIYGYSHVEQVLVTVNILIRRALHQLEYYREGSQPDALIGLPKEWSQDQIVTFQKHFDALLSGNSALRRHVRFMPGDFKYQETKAPPLKDVYDEFLARIICYVFSISPEPFVGQVNRATAESSQARAIAEGLAPLQKHMRMLMNRIIQRDMGFTELEFAWQDTRQQDPREAAQIDVAYVSAGILTPNEVRQKMGLEKLRGNEKEEANVTKFNPHHDERGRFTTANNAVAPNYEELPDLSPSRDISEPKNEPNTAAVPIASARLIPAIAGALGIVAAASQQAKLRPVSMNMEEDNSDSDTSGSNHSNNDYNNKKPKEPKDGSDYEWSFGSYKSKERWDNQMHGREWTEQEITNTIKTGTKEPAQNYINKANTATRYTNSQTGKFIVRDDVTKEIIQIGNKGYQPNKFPSQ